MTSDKCKDRQVAIIVGPAQLLADRIISRIRKLFAKHDVFFDTARNYIVVNECEIMSVPSHNIDSLTVKKS